MRCVPCRIRLRQLCGLTVRSRDSTHDTSCEIGISGKSTYIGGRRTAFDSAIRRSSCRANGRRSLSDRLAMCSFRPFCVKDESPRAEETALLSTAPRMVQPLQNGGHNALRAAPNAASQETSFWPSSWTIFSPAPSFEMLPAVPSHTLLSRGLALKAPQAISDEPRAPTKVLPSALDILAAP